MVQTLLAPAVYEAAAPLPAGGGVASRPTRRGEAWPQASRSPPNWRAPNHRTAPGPWRGVDAALLTPRTDSGLMYSACVHAEALLRWDSSRGAYHRFIVS